MDGNILATGEFEVMLSKGLGRHFAQDEKERLFQNAKNISDLLGVVMDRSTHEGNSPTNKRATKGALKSGLG
jgi:hypothetical protein